MGYNDGRIDYVAILYGQHKKRRLKREQVAELCSVLTQTGFKIGQNRVDSVLFMSVMLFFDPVRFTDKYGAQVSCELVPTRVAHDQNSLLLSATAYEERLHQDCDRGWHSLYEPIYTPNPTGVHQANHKHNKSCSCDHDPAASALLPVLGLHHLDR
jgi:hypothetical protein